MGCGLQAFGKRLGCVAARAFILFFLQAQTGVINGPTAAAMASWLGPRCGLPCDLGRKANSFFFFVPLAFFVCVNLTCILEKISIRLVVVKPSCLAVEEGS